MPASELPVVSAYLIPVCPPQLKAALLLDLT